MMIPFAAQNGTVPHGHHRDRGSQGLDLLEALVQRKSAISSIELDRRNVSYLGNRLK